MLCNNECGNRRQKKTFYKIILSIMNTTQKHDIVTGMGVFNVKLGESNKGVEKYTIAHCLENINGHGEALAEFLYCLTSS